MKKDQISDIEKLQKRINELEEQNNLLLSFQKADIESQKIIDQDLSAFFNLSLDLLCIADLSGNFLKVNKSWEKLLGYSIEQLERSKFLDFVHPDDMEQTLEAMKQLEGQVPVINFVNRYRCANGSWKHIEWRSQPIGKIVFAAAQDVTERKQHHEALEASEERFWLVADATDLGIWDWNVPTNKVYYSPQWKKQVGYEDFELKNEYKTWEDLLHPDDYERMHREVKNFLAKPSGAFTSEFRLRHKNGSYIWIHNRASAKIDSEGRVVRFFGAHTDITQRKKWEEYIRQAKETYQGIIDCLNEAVYIQDEQGIFIEVNKTAERFYGYPRDYFIGKTPEFLSAPEVNNLDEVKEALSKAIQGHSSVFEFWGMRKDGQIFPKEVSVSPGIYFGQKVVIAVARDISERKEAEIMLKEKTEQIEQQNEEYKQLNNELLIAKETLGESEKKFRNLVESAFDGIYLLQGRRFKYVNPSFCEITGYSYIELTSVEFNFTHLLSEKARRIVEERFMSRVLGDVIPARYEFQMITKNHEVREVEVSTVPIGFGEDVQIMGIIRDITQRRSMEREIAFRSKLQGLLINLGMRFINLPVQKINTEINSALAEMGQFFDVDRAYIFTYDFQTRTTSNTFEWCAADIPSEIDNLQNLPLDLIPSWVNNHSKDKVIHIPKVFEMAEDDSVREILLSQGIKSVITIPMTYETECIGFVGFDSVKDYREWSESETTLLKLFANLLVNVQVKTRFEQSLREAKIKAEVKQIQVRNIIDFSPVGIVLIDPTGKVIDVNEAAIKMLGSPSSDATKRINIFQTPALKEIGFTTDLSQCIATKSSVYNEKRYVSIWGKEVFVKYYLVPVIINNEIESVLANIEDITQTKETEIKLIKLKEQAEESDRLKSAFLANMSHEIRTPMNAICGFSNLLLNPELTSDQLQYFVEIININSQQLLALINDIIDVSKIEAGQVRVSSSSFNLSKSLRDIHIQYSLVAKSKQIDLVIREDLITKDFHISTDETKLKQIIGNLIYNAIKFTEKGAVEFGYRLSGNTIEFFIKDTGIGIHHDNFNKIFERFQQVENATTESRRGTGLGLSIAKAFVELLGGEIWLTSQLGVGSTFFFTIPLKQSEPISNNLPIKTPEILLCEGKTILIAEDDNPNYLYIKELLNPTKAKIIHAKNGYEAIELCNTYPIDIVLMDIKMPILNGLETATELRKNGFDMPIIAQTAYAFAEDRTKALEHGCNDYIAKPIVKEELFNLIKKWITC